MCISAVPQSETWNNLLSWEENELHKTVILRLQLILGKKAASKPTQLPRTADFSINNSILTLCPSPIYSLLHKQYANAINTL